MQEKIKWGLDKLKNCNSEINIKKTSVAFSGFDPYLGLVDEFFTYVKNNFSVFCFFLGVICKLFLSLNHFLIVNNFTIKLS